jgi:lactobin A/cerein 7B family class IIb bacteriocin
MTAQARNHATMVRERHRAGRFSRNTFINRIQITQALETPPPGSYYPGTGEVGYATLEVVYSRERSSRLVVSGPGPARVTLRLASRCSVLSHSGTATEDRGMKHLLNGVAVVAALAIAAPVWAQTSAPMTPSSRAPAAPAASAPAPAAPMATKARHKRVAHRKATRRGMAPKAGPDSVASQLNAQELARVQGGGGPPPVAGGMAPGTLGGGYGQPAPTQGIPGGNQPSASAHPPPFR